MDDFGQVEGPVYALGKRLGQDEHTVY